MLSSHRVIKLFLPATDQISPSPPTRDAGSGRRTACPTSGGKTPPTLTKIWTSALNNTIQQTTHRQQLRHPAIEFGLLPARQLLPPAGWRNTLSEAVQELAHLRQMKSTRLRETQHS